jgi:predicted permease
MTSFFNIILNIIGPIFLIVGLTVLIDRRYSPDPRSISRMAIYLFSPCLALDGIAKSDLLASELGKIAAMATLSMFAMALVGWLLTRVFRFERSLQSAFLISVILVNAGNYGVPLNEFAFGRPGLQRAIVYFVTSAVMVNTLGVYLASRGTASVRQSLMNVLTVPLPYATILGIYLNVNQLTLPLPIDRVVALLSQAANPCMLVVLGLNLSRTLSNETLRGRLGPIALATATRLGIAPIIAFLLARLLGLSGLAWQVSIVETSMPTAVMSGVLATEFGSDAEFTTAVVLVSTLVSILSLSIVLSLVM